MNSFPVHVIGTQRKRTGRNTDNIKGMPTRHTFSSRKSHVIASVSNPSLPLSMIKANNPVVLAPRTSVPRKSITGFMHPSEHPMECRSSYIGFAMSSIISMH